ncbi:MAG: hypothetical protein K0U54_11695, partial [Bacteroidetes bacterium]|nr:hypothetical protein [Bacteroidota bacterium]
DRFANHIKKPTFANNKLVWFNRLKEGQRFKNRPPGVSEVEKYRAMGEHEIHMIWDKILRIKDTINTERLTRNQYNLYLDKFTALMNILETGTLRAFDLFWKAFPTEPDPDYRAPKPFTLFDFLDSSDDGESSEEDGDPI